MVCRICSKLLSLSILVLLANGHHESYSNYYSSKKPDYKKIRYVPDFTAVLGMYLFYNDTNFFNKQNYQAIKHDIVSPPSGIPPPRKRYKPTIS